jgi:hypothetical protein
MKLQKWDFVLYEKFIPTLCYLRLCMWFILVVEILFIRFDNVGVWGNVSCPTIQQMSKCTTHVLLIPPHLCILQLARSLWWKDMNFPSFKQILVLKVIMNLVNDHEGTSLLSSSFMHYKFSWCRIGINSNNKSKFLVGGFKLYNLLLALLWVASTSDDQTIFGYLVVMVKLGWWIVNHNCCVHNEPRVCLALWNVFGGCRCPKLRLS